MEENIKPKIKLAIVGSRTFNDYEYMKSVIYKHFTGMDILCIISGGARGADALGERFAKEHDIECVVYRADWNKYGKRAGFIRNHDIINACTHCVAFWDGESRGTKHDIDLCREQGKECIVARF